MPYCSFNLIKRREWGWGLNAMGEMTRGNGGNDYGKLWGK